MLCNLMPDRIPGIRHKEELIVATARLPFMPRIPIVGLACSTFLILLSSSAVPQEPARAGAGSGN
jgi:hypothetical protein